MNKKIAWITLLAAVMLMAPAEAQAQALLKPQTPALDLNLGIGKTGIGKGYSASSAFHLFPRGSVYPIIRYSWTGDASVTDDKSVIAAGGTEQVNGTQYAAGLGAEFTVKKWRRWEFDLSAENGFQKTTFRYRVRVQGRTFSGLETRSGYYLLPAAKIKYWLTDRSNLFTSVGVFARGDPTDGDGLGRTVILAGYTRRFDLAKIGTFFKKL